MRRPIAKVPFYCLFPLVLILASKISHASSNNNNFPNSNYHSSSAPFNLQNNVNNYNSNMPSNKSNVLERPQAGADSGAMQELKETIRNQAAEIEALQKKLAGTGSSKGIAAPVAHGGGHGNVEEISREELKAYLSMPFYAIATKRVGWLGVFLVSLSLTAVIMNGFEHTLSRQLELAYFVPLLAGHGGNTGGQTVGTVLSGFSAGTLTVQDAPRVIAKESMSGLVMGTILGMCVGPIIHYCMGISFHVSTVIFCTLPLVSTIASGLGASIPFACLALGLDPSVIAAPAMTSFVDVSGLMAYFLIAQRVFAFFKIDL